MGKSARILAAIGLSACAWAAPAIGAVKGDPLEQALSAIPTAAHMTAWQRIQGCRMRIDRRTSEVTTAVYPIARLDVRAGDTIIDVLVDLPRPPGFDPATDDPSLLKDVALRWIVHAGKARPDTGWATAIQTATASVNGLPC